jgi:GNAT superfamily N-acetyltransferase
MADLLVRLYQLAPVEPVLEALSGEGIAVRRALPAEREAIADLARSHGSPAWAAECETALGRLPATCFVAVKTGSAAPGGTAGYPTEPQQLLGFACRDATWRGFFGPELVHPEHRGRGIGRALVLAVLHDMLAAGYGYAIIGWASSAEFYRRAVGATLIDGSEPGMYPPPLRVR